MNINREKPRLGWIGLGEMGLPMCKSLISAGYPVQGFDLKEAPLQECLDAGGSTAESMKRLVETNDIILTTLPSSESFIKAAEEALIPHAREGQIFIELGTTMPSELIRLEKLFRSKGAVLMDVPVSGGKYGAEHRALKMFVGGEQEIMELCRPLLAVIGGADHIYYCGGTGSGQKMKGVNQLKMGLINAAALEVIAFGVRSGLAPELICRVFPEANWSMVTALAEKIAKGEGEMEGVKFRELPYYIEESKRNGFSLPITEAVYDFCDKGERVVIDDHRPAPSFWHELMAGQQGE